MLELFRGIPVEPAQPERRIGEEQVAAGRVHQVIRAVEPLAVVSSGERGLREFRFVEAGDLASATSSASTKLIHGGLRYLDTP